MKSVKNVESYFGAKSLKTLLAVLSVKQSWNNNQPAKNDAKNQKATKDILIRIAKTTFKSAIN